MHEGGRQGGEAGGSGNLGHAVGILPCRQRGAPEAYPIPKAFSLLKKRADRLHITLNAPEECCQNIK